MNTYPSLPPPAPSQPVPFHDRLGAALVRAGLTVAALAAAVDCRSRRLADWLSGRRKPSGTDGFELLARIEQAVAAPAGSLRQAVQHGLRALGSVKATRRRLVGATAYGRHLAAATKAAAKQKIPRRLPRKAWPDGVKHIVANHLKHQIGKAVAHGKVPGAERPWKRRSAAGYLGGTLRVFLSNQARFLGFHARQSNLPPA